jgi:hypothetical protein
LRNGWFSNLSFFVRALPISPDAPVIAINLGSVIRKYSYGFNVFHQCSQLTSSSNQNTEWNHFDKVFLGNLWGYSQVVR